MNKRKIAKQLFSVSIILVFFLFVDKVVHADTTLVANGTCADSGDCQLTDLMQVAITATTIILGLTGTVALVAFVYAGFLFLISAGSSEKVNQAKNVIKGSIIGITIVFLSFTIISYVFKLLNVSGNWWESSWF